MLCIIVFTRKSVKDGKLVFLFLICKYFVCEFKELIV